MHSSKIQYMYIPLVLALSTLQNSVFSTRFSFTKQSVNNYAGLNAKKGFHQAEMQNKIITHVQGHLTRWNIFFAHYHTVNQKWGEK